VPYLGERRIDQLARGDLEDYRAHLVRYYAGSSVNGVLRVRRAENPRLHAIKKWGSLWGSGRPVLRNYRAGHGTRTRDFNLGKVALYQLS
jgi:hypothetical protein